MFLKRGERLENVVYRVKQVGKKQLLSVTARIIPSDTMENNYLILPLPTNIVSFKTNALLADAHNEESLFFIETLHQYYPNFPIACIPLNLNGNAQEISYTFRYTPFREDIFFVPTLESSFEEFDPDKEVFCNYTVWMCAVKDVWCRKEFTGWQQNADTLAAVEHIALGMSDMMVRRALWGLWHG